MCCFPEPCFISLSRLAARGDAIGPFHILARGILRPFAHFGIAHSKERTHIFDVFRGEEPGGALVATWGKQPGFLASRAILTVEDSFLVAESLRVAVEWAGATAIARLFPIAHADGAPSPIS